MSKSDLRARPIYHRKLESIRAHITIVLAALAIARFIEQRTGVPIKRFIQQLREIRGGTVQVFGVEIQARPEISRDVGEMVGCLGLGY